MNGMSYKGVVILLVVAIVATLLCVKVVGTWTTDVPPENCTQAEWQELRGYAMLCEAGDTVGNARKLNDILVLTGFRGDEIMKRLDIDDKMLGRYLKDGLIKAGDQLVHDCKQNHLASSDVDTEELRASIGLFADSPYRFKQLGFDENDKVWKKIPLYQTTLAILDCWEGNYDNFLDINKNLDKPGVRKALDLDQRQINLMRHSVALEAAREEVTIGKLRPYQFEYSRYLGWIKFGKLKPEEIPATENEVLGFRKEAARELARTHLYFLRQGPEFEGYDQERVLTVRELVKEGLVTLSQIPTSEKELRSFPPNPKDNNWD